MTVKQTIIGGVVTTLIAGGLATGLAVTNTGVFAQCSGGPPHNLAVIGLQEACPAPGTNNPAACVFSSPSTVAFCDNFSRSLGTGNRSGQLDGDVWGVSRVNPDYGGNVGQSWADAWVPTTLYDTCNPAGVLVNPDNDVQICNGQLVESVNDNHAVTAANQGTVNDLGGVDSLAMYPKQRFEFGGRTGKVVFDVSNDTGGGHTAWPEFWVTDLPVPDPFAHNFDYHDIPQYGFGIRLDNGCAPGVGNQCGPAATCTSANTGYLSSVGTVATVDNYVINDTDVPSEQTGGLSLIPDGCIQEPVGPPQGAASLNHFEIDVSTTQIDVWGTNPFTGTLNLTNTPLIHLATIIPPVSAETGTHNLGFTSGLIWIEDDHYNGNKAVDPKLQAMHTFTWDNVGFDGPLDARDLTFDAADADTPPGSQPGGQTMVNLGYESIVPQANPQLTVAVPAVSGLGSAAAAKLLFNTGPQSAPPVPAGAPPGTQPGVTFTYQLNGGPVHTYYWPFPDGLPSGAFTPRTMAIPISISELVAGTNTVTLSDNDAFPDGLFVYNLDILLVGAAGVVPPVIGTTP